jgi:para-nitrobenzyl esterase
MLSRLAGAGFRIGGSMARDVDVRVRQGTVRGAASGDHVNWLGVPYAQPPVGALRWRAPLPADPWPGVRRTAQPAAEAVQQPKAGQPPAGEDCLYLDVCAPAGAPRPGGWPVLVFFHGGGDVAGSAEQLGLGEAFARAGIVVVKPQYRLGALGFLNLGRLFTEEADSGACGLLDQIAALRWVHNNVASFGGNPDRITIYGQSAGAKAIGDLLGSPMTRGLFAQAISSSGGAEDIAAPAATTTVAKLFLTALGTSRMDVLRSAPAEDILAAQQTIMPGVTGTWTWRPTMHPGAAPGLPIDAIGRGSASGVRCLIGSNANEAAFFAAIGGLDICIGPAFDNLVSILGPQRTTELLDTYKRGRGVDDRHALLAGMGDERYTVGTLRAADAQSAFGPVYRYRLDAAAPGMPVDMDGAHGTDLYMAWQRPAPSAGPSTPARQNLSRILHQAWVAFIKTGCPAAAGLPQWQRYSQPERQTMILSDDSHSEADPRCDERLIWADTRWEYGTWFPLPSSTHSPGAR